MAIVLAHRGNIDGPDPARENSSDSIVAALARGCGVETDLRRTPSGTFYLSHDALESPKASDPVFHRFSSFPNALIALNFKENGYEPALVDYLRTHAVLGQVVVFDMELVEQVRGRTLELLHSLEPRVRLAARTSDRDEPLADALTRGPASVVWLDEFDGPWSCEQDVRLIHASGRRVFAVSPDLHGAGLAESKARWTQFCSWGVDAICTDYAAELEAFQAGRT